MKIIINNSRRIILCLSNHETLKIIELELLAILKKNKRGRQSVKVRINQDLVKLYLCSWKEMEETLIKRINNPPIKTIIYMITNRPEKIFTLLLSRIIIKLKGIIFRLDQRAEFWELKTIKKNKSKISLKI
jgi:hypothetical protein